MNQIALFVLSLVLASGCTPDLDPLDEAMSQTSIDACRGDCTNRYTCEALGEGDWCRSDCEGEADVEACVASCIDELIARCEARCLEDLRRIAGTHSARCVRERRADTECGATLDCDDYTLVTDTEDYTCRDHAGWSYDVGACD